MTCSIKLIKTHHFFAFLNQTFIIPSEILSVCLRRWPASASPRIDAKVCLRRPFALLYTENEWNWKYHIDPFWLLVWFNLSCSNKSDSLSKAIFSRTTELWLELQRHQQSYFTSLNSYSVFIGLSLLQKQWNFNSDCLEQDLVFNDCREK